MEKQDPRNQMSTAIFTDDCATTSRSEKSLGELCLKFLNYFGAPNEERTVNLEDCLEPLGIERRRIYDIVNILESFEVIKRQSKNLYSLQDPQLIKKRIQDLEVTFWLHAICRIRRKSGLVR